MNTKTDEGLYEKARKLFISKASIDEFAGWATPRQVDAVHRLLDTELANRERAKHDRLLRRARFPVVKGLDGYDFTNVRLPCFASIFLKQFLHYLSAVWAAGFQQELHHMTAQTRTGTGPPCLYIPET